MCPPRNFTRPPHLAPLLTALLIALAACGPVPTDAPTALAISAPTLTPLAAPSLTATRVQPTAPPNVTRTVAPTTNAPRPSPFPTPTNAQSLRLALEYADFEMRAISLSPTLQRAKQHAENVVNVLVGPGGRWYGDGDGDGGFDVLADARGVLPALTGSEPGLALLVYAQSDAAGRAAIADTIIGSVEKWRASPVARYDEIERAIAGTDLNRNIVRELDGHAMRAVAWARLVLTKAATLQDAKIYAGVHGVIHTQLSLEAARQIP